MDFHRQQKDAFSWLTWEIVNGDRAGGFVTGTFDHYWKDFDGRDAFDALDGADMAKTFDAATESSSSGFWIHMASASRAQPGATAPSKFSQLTHYYVRPADVPRFEDALETIKARARQDLLADLLELVPAGERRRRAALRAVDPARQLCRLRAAREDPDAGADRGDGRAQGE